MKAEILAIGTELLLGQITNTNAAYISQRLAEAGIDLYYHTTVGDNEARMETALRTALERADVVIATGGLGPTEDDVTRKVFSKVLGKRLVLNEVVLQKIRERFAQLGRKMTANNEKQALIPQHATVLHNPMGTAPGFMLEVGKKKVVALPGVPREMKVLLDEQVIPLLSKGVKAKEVICSRVLRTCGVTESKLDELMGDFIRQEFNPTVALLAHGAEIHMRLTVKAPSPQEAQRKLEEMEERVRQRVGDLIFGRDEQTLEEVVGALLVINRLRLAVAESCTGGLLAHRLTNIPGSSEYFERGVVAYSDRAKENILGVSAELIAEKGAVSPEVAQAMAKGIKRIGRTELGIGITGIAGPGGGTEEKPVGLVYISLAAPDGFVNKKFLFAAVDRATVKLRATQMALEMVRRYLIKA